MVPKENTFSCGSNGNWSIKNHSKCEPIECPIEEVEHSIYE